jgi:TPR repeat protein
MGHKEEDKALIISKHYSVIRLYNNDSIKNGTQLQVNEKTKVRMLEKATKEGYTQLQYQIGVWHENNRNYSSAFKWLSRAVTIRVTDAYYRVGVLYATGKGVEQYFRMSANMLYKAAEKEHEDACYCLGQLYQYGYGVELNYLKAYQFYKKAQEMGQAEAYTLLNITLETAVTLNGGIKESIMGPSSEPYQDSLSMCKCAAEQGSTEIQFQVGFAYEYIVSEPDYANAFNWYSMAAESSHREAIYHLGLLYEKGLGISQDYQKAIQLYNNAGHLYSDKALHQLGIAYHYGKGVYIDPITAIEYYTLSTNFGIPEYQCFLGRLYEEGQIVQKNPQEALKWYTKAYIQGYDDVSSVLYSMYDHKSYEDFFFIKRFQNLLIASFDYFRLSKIYNYYDNNDSILRLATFYALGYGTEKNSREAGKYIKKRYSYDSNVSVETFIDDLNDLSVSEKLDILRGLEEDEEIMNQIGKDGLIKFAEVFYDKLTQTQQHNYNKIQDQGKANSTQHCIIKKDY